MLVAIAIPVFTTQLEKSREATDIANVRSGYAAAMTQYMTEGSGTATVGTKQQQPGWQGESGVLTVQVNGTESTQAIPEWATGKTTYNLAVGNDGSGEFSFSIGVN